MYGVEVHKGSFATEADFGPLAKSFQNAYVGVKVRSAGAGEFIPLGNTAAIVDTNSSCPGSWSLDGNAGNPPGSYLGTADSQDLILKAGNIEVLHAPSGNNSVGLSGAAVNSASGSRSTSLSAAHYAFGSYSFAGGSSASTNFSGSFVWGDNPSTPHVISDTAPNQFVVQAGGGAAINGTPKDAGTELSLYPGTGGGGFDYSNLFFGTKGVGGVQLSVGDESSTTSNDASFYVDQYDGTNRFRKFVIGSGITVNDPATIPTGHFRQDLDIAQRSVGGDPGISLHRATPNPLSYLITGYLFGLSFDLQDSAHPAGSHLGDFDTSGNFTITGGAYKPGGGMWATTSDRRIKQDIAPIENAVDTLLKLKPVSFHYTPEYREAANHLPDKRNLGFIAQEFAEVFPEAVSSTGRHAPGAPEDAAPILALDPNPAIITTVAAVQELAIEANDLKTENAALRKQIDALAARLNALEHRNGE